LVVTALVNHIQLPTDFKALLPCTRYTHTQYTRSPYHRNLGEIKTRDGILQFSIHFVMEFLLHKVKKSMANSITMLLF